MERLLFKKQEFEELYGCERLTPEQWNSFAKPDIWIGLLYLIPGVIYLILYFPCLIVMREKKFSKHSCYKLMFLLGFFDVFGVILSAIIPGIQTFQAAFSGEVFCSHRIFNYIVGCFSTGLWGCTCLTCIILAFNRTLDLLNPKIWEKLFDGKRTYFWYVPPVFWGGYFVLFSYPHVYTTIAFAFFFDPYHGIEAPGFLHNDAIRPHYVHSTNNIGTTILLIAMYSILCLFMLCKTKKAKGAMKITQTQKMIFIQCFLLCVITLTTASIYVIMQWINTPVWLIVIGQITWQGAHGGAAVIYIILNKSLQKSIKKLFILRTLFKSSIPKIKVKSVEISRQKNFS
ncbi:hypothetical protein FO519_003041 [Halicephalobus sp. NKZ332]|nr:hypothetical protein FO519_003041 [Halicephalobus sp. NKZ332]